MNNSAPQKIYPGQKTDAVTQKEKPARKGITMRKGKRKGSIVGYDE